MSQPSARTCPACGLIHPPGATICDCGQDLSSPTATVARPGRRFLASGSLSRRGFWGFAAAGVVLAVAYLLVAGRVIGDRDAESIVFWIAAALASLIAVSTLWRGHMAVVVSILALPATLLFTMGLATLGRVGLWSNQPIEDVGDFARLALAAVVFLVGLYLAWGFVYAVFRLTRPAWMFWFLPLGLLAGLCVGIANIPGLTSSFAWHGAWVSISLILPVALAGGVMGAWSEVE